MVPTRYGQNLSNRLHMHDWGHHGARCNHYNREGLRDCSKPVKPTNHVVEYLPLCASHKRVKKRIRATRCRAECCDGDGICGSIIILRPLMIQVCSVHEKHGICPINKLPEELLSIIIGYVVPKRAHSFAARRHYLKTVGLVNKTFQRITQAICCQSPDRPLGAEISTSLDGVPVIEFLGSIFCPNAVWLNELPAHALQRPAWALQESSTLDLLKPFKHFQINVKIHEAQREHILSELYVLVKQLTQALGYWENFNKQGDRIRLQIAVTYHYDIDNIAFHESQLASIIKHIAIMLHPEDSPKQLSWSYELVYGKGCIPIARGPSRSSEFSCLRTERVDAAVEMASAATEGRSQTNLSADFETISCLCYNLSISGRMERNGWFLHKATMDYANRNEPALRSKAIALSKLAREHFDRQSEICDFGKWLVRSPDRERLGPPPWASSAKTYWPPSA